ncbi:AGE3 [Auxenochlorella protothecoides x Auxenochlorella symbiontica]
MRRTRAAAVALLSADPIANQIKPAPPLQGRQSGRGPQGIEARSLKSTAHVVVAQVEPPQQKTGSPASKKKRSKAALDPSGFVQKDILSIRNKASRIASQLNGLYLNPKVPLDSASPFQLLVAVILSAQTTDVKVNTVTPALFKLAATSSAMADADLAEVTAIIQPLGLSATKAKHLKGMSKMLVALHGGQVPSSYAELEALPGVGHKTASVIMSHCFGVPAFPVDTHIHRLAERWGLSSGKSVEQTEADLKAVFREELWNKLHLQLIWFGRQHCSARAHNPQACPVCVWAAPNRAKE